MKNMTMVQVKVKQGASELTTWLPRDKRLKIGTCLTLEKEEGDWVIVDMYPEATVELSSINRGWNNNI